MTGTLFQAAGTLVLLPFYTYPSPQRVIYRLHPPLRPTIFLYEDHYHMAVQLSTAVRNARLDTIESTIGASARLKIFTGAQPANCAAADSGTLLADITVPSDWMNAASGGSKTYIASWSDASADGTGTAAHFRLYETTAATCHMQGSVGTSGTDMVVDSTSFTAGQTFTITSFTLTDANA